MKFQAPVTFFQPLLFIFKGINNNRVKIGYKTWLPFFRLTSTLSRYFAAMLDSYWFKWNSNLIGRFTAWLCILLHKCIISCVSHFLLYKRNFIQLSLNAHLSHSTGTTNMKMQSNFGALSEADTEASKFTKSFSCPYLVLPILYLDESKPIWHTHLIEKKMRQEKLVTWKQYFSVYHFCQMLNMRVFFSLPRLTLGWSGWKSCGWVFNEMVLPKTAMPLRETFRENEKAKRIGFMLGKQLWHVKFNLKELFPAEAKLTERTSVGLPWTHMLLWAEAKAADL